MRIGLSAVPAVAPILSRVIEPACGGVKGAGGAYVGSARLMPYFVEVNLWWVAESRKYKIDWVSIT